MSSRQALASAVIQASIVGVAVVVGRTARWRARRRPTTTIELPAPREPRVVIDLTDNEGVPARRG